MRLVVYPARRLSGSFTPPGDKSISHRAVMLSALAEGQSRIDGFLNGADTLATVSVFRELGVEIEHESGGLQVQGVGLTGLTAPRQPLNFGNAGTGMRLSAGILAGQTFTSVLDGDASLRGRPMGRIMRPLRAMGADITGEVGCPPLQVHGSSLSGIDWQSEVASAQVKSAILLAGLLASGKTRVSEPSLSRDHTERMLQAAGVKVRRDGLTVTVEGGSRLQHRHWRIPADPSSAAFAVVAAQLLPDSSVTAQNVGVNPTRIGLFDVLGKMRAQLALTNSSEHSGEPVADVVSRSAPLQAITIEGDDVVRSIDEIPILMVAAARARGETCINDAAELRVKESDRLAVMSKGLSELGVELVEQPDGVKIRGSKRPFWGGEVDACHDHRCAMAFAVAALAARDRVVIYNAEEIVTSYPNFVADLNTMGADIQIEGVDE